MSWMWFEVPAGLTKERVGWGGTSSWLAGRRGIHWVLLQVLELPSAAWRGSFRHLYSEPPRAFGKGNNVCTCRHTEDTKINVTAETTTYASAVLERGGSCALGSLRSLHRCGGQAAACSHISRMSNRHHHRVVALVII